MRGLQEIVPIQDVFASGLGAIERMDGGLYRLWFYVLQAPAGDDEGEAEKIVVAKVIAPVSAVPDTVLKLVASISEHHPAGLVPMVADLVN